MQKHLTLCTLMFVLCLSVRGQWTSDLPILTIATEDVIVDEPKVGGVLKWFKKDTTGDPIFQHAIGIELRGNTSFHFFPKKGFGLEFRDSDKDDIEKEIFGWPKGSDFVIHSPYSDKSLMRNALAYTIGSKVMDYAPRCELIELIINGEYYGVCLMVEKIDRDRERIAIKNPRQEDESGGYIFKIDKGPEEEVVWTSEISDKPDIFTQIRMHKPRLSELTDQQIDYIQNLFDRLDELSLNYGFAGVEKGYRSLVDVGSLIDFILINEAAKNMDAYRISTYFYKNSDSRDHRIYFGPIWDFNIAWGNTNYCEGYSTDGWAYDYPEVCPQGTIRPHFWWKRWLQDPILQNAINHRWMSLRRSVLSDQNVINDIDSLSHILAEPQKRNFEKWPVLGKYVWPNDFIGDTFEEEVDYLKRWTLQRFRWMDITLKNLDYNVSQDTSLLLFEILPNPSIDYFTIYFSRSDIADEITLEVFNGQGQFLNEINLFEEGSSHLDWHPPASQGVFYLKVWRSGKLMDVRKLVKIN